MGTLVKRHLARQLGLDPGQIYHCTVMPCYDKKLEGSRDDFVIPGKLEGSLSWPSILQLHAMLPSFAGCHWSRPKLPCHDCPLDLHIESVRVP